MLKAGNNTFFSSSIFIFITRFFPLLANLLVIIFFSRVLDAEVYGAYQNFWIQLYLLNPLACLGIHVLIVTYSPEKIKSLAGRIKPMQYLSFFGWMLLVSAAFSFFRNSASDISWLIPFAFILSYSLALIAEYLLIAFKKFWLVSSVSVSYAAIYLLLHWSLLEGNIDTDTLFGYLAILILVKFCIYGVIVYQSLKKQEPGTSDVQPLKEIRSLWMHLGFYDVSQMIFRWLDKFIISLLLTKELSAIYFNGSQEIPVLSVILGAVGSAALIQLAGNKNSKDEAHTLIVSNYSARILSAVVFPLFFFFLFFSKELFVVLLSEKYLASASIFVVSVFTMPLYAYSLTTILQNKHRGGIINIGAILDLVIALGLMYPFYQLLGLPGVALSIVVSSYLQAAFYLYHTGKTLNVGIAKLLPLGNWLLKLIVFFFLFITIHYLLHASFSDQIVLFLGGGIATAITVISLITELRISKRKYGDAFSRT